MKNFILGIICTICFCALCSFTQWSAPLGMRNVYLEEVSLNQHKYVIATTGASNSPGVALIHSPNCKCRKK